MAQTLNDFNNQRPSELTKPHYVINSIKITGNKRTKEQIILRELNFKQGEKMSLNELENRKVRSQQNLINTSLFNFVTITNTINDSNQSTEIHIDLKERWYTWPSPFLEVQDRNFNSWWETKDLYRINYGIYLTFENVRGRNETAVLKFRRGYTEQYGFSYKIPYINKQQSIGINIGYNFFRNNEIAYSTYGNQLLFFRNINNFVRQEQEAKVGISFRKGLYTKHNLEALFTNSSVTNDIQNLNPTYFNENKNNISYLSLQYTFKIDVKDAKVYPLKGYSFECGFTKNGLNLLRHESIDNFLLYSTIKNYWGICPRTYLATCLKLRYTSNSVPVYYLNRALGFNDFVRGYEYYVVDGQSYGMSKTSIKFQIVKPRVLEIPVKHFEKFKSIPYSAYISTFGDAAFVQDKFYYKDNPLSNAWLLGCGLGLDIVTYYDNVIRIEVSMNKMKQKGLFLHFTAPI